MSLNRIVVVGRLGKDPDSKFTPTGTPVVNFSIAVNRFTKDEAGKFDTDWFDVVAWRKTAEFVGNYVHKGNLVSIDGRLQTRKWVAQDGTNRTAFEIVADNVENLSPRSDSETSADAPERSRPRTEPERVAQQVATLDDDLADGVDPFADS